MFCSLCLWSSCQHFGPWSYLMPPHLAKPTLDFLSAVDRPMLRDCRTTGPFSQLVIATQRVIESLSGGLLRWGRCRLGRKEGWWDGWSVLAVSLGHCCVLWLSIPMWFSSAMSHRVQSHWVQSGSSTEGCGLRRFWTILPHGGSPAERFLVYHCVLAKQVSCFK